MWNKQTLQTVYEMLRDCASDPSAQNGKRLADWHKAHSDKYWASMYGRKMPATNRIDAICENTIWNDVFVWLEKYPAFCAESDAKPLADRIAFYLENAAKPLAQRAFTNSDATHIVCAYDNEEMLDGATDDEVAVYRRVAEQLCEQGETVGLVAVGYGSYGGNRAFECDFERARQCMHALVDEKGDIYHKECYANTLGYIYYYGRTNGGVPQYDLAFKYFTFAACGGVYEAKYKLADMYKHGYGVIQSPAVACRMIQELYAENLPYMLREAYDCKFADIALRMGNNALDEVDDYSDYEAALCYYLQAAFAIRMRMQAHTYYGDEKVAAAIDNAIAAVKQKMKFRPRNSLRFSYLGYLLSSNLKDGRQMEVTVRKLKQGYQFTFRMHKRKDGVRARIFLSVAEMEYCGMVDRLTVTANTAGEIPCGKFVFDRVEYDDLSLHGETALSLPSDIEYRFKRPT